MNNSLWLAWKYISYYKYRHFLLVFSLSLVMFLPFGLRKLIRMSEQRLMERAASTPLIIGAKGSHTDLVINTLYYQQERQESLSYGFGARLDSAGFGHSIPVLSIFKARNFPIIGTNPDYYRFRGLSLSEGRWPALLGECVIGSGIAEALGLQTGDSLISSPENLFDLAGVYPLKMTISGVMKPANSPDDRAIFTDVKTTWIIMGLGHGHEDLSRVTDPTLVYSRDSSGIKATAKLFLYNRLTSENMADLHFHGDMNTYPLTSLIFVPDDEKGLTLLRGRFESGELPEQAVVPKEVVRHLLQSIFKMEQVFNAVFILVAISTLIIFALIITLSLRLRAPELHTLFTIGAARLRQGQILSTELLILLTLSALLAFIYLQFSGLWVDDFIDRFVI